MLLPYTYYQTPQGKQDRTHQHTHTHTHTHARARVSTIDNNKKTSRYKWGKYHAEITTEPTISSQHISRLKLSCCLYSLMHIGYITVWYKNRLLVHTHTGTPFVSPLTCVAVPSPHCDSTSAGRNTSTTLVTTRCERGWWGWGWRWPPNQPINHPPNQLID